MEEEFILDEESIENDDSKNANEDESDVGDDGSKGDDPKGDDNPKDGDNPKDDDPNGNQNDEAGLIDFLNQSIGVKFEKDGKPVSYEETEEGLLSYVRDLKDYYKNEAVNELLQSDQRFRDYYLAINEGRTDEEYFNNNVKDKFLNFQLTENSDESDHVKVINAFYNKKGIPSSEVKSIIELYKNNNELETKSKELLELLKVQEKEEDKLEADKRENHRKENEKLVLEYYNKVKDIITKGNIDNAIVVPEVDKDKFFDYISKPVNEDGESQEYLDALKESVETRLLISYLRFRNFNVKDYLKLVVSNQNTQNLRDKLKKGQQRDFKGSKGDSNFNNLKSGSDISLENIE